MVNRYTLHTGICTGNNYIKPHDEGEYILYEDYRKLKEKHEDLKRRHFAALYSNMTGEMLAYNPPHND